MNPVDHDFEDGNGPVPAHRHTNPDGSEGGWVSDTASVADTATIGRDAYVYGNAIVDGNAQVYDNAFVSGNAWVYDRAYVFGDARVYGNAYVYVFGDARVYDRAYVFGDARVYGNARVLGNAHVYDSARVYGTVRVFGTAKVFGSARVYGNARVYGSKIYNTSIYCGYWSSIDVGTKPLIIDAHGLLCAVTGTSVIINGNSRTYREWEANPTEEWVNVEPYLRHLRSKLLDDGVSIEGKTRYEYLECC